MGDGPAVAIADHSTFRSSILERLFAEDGFCVVATVTTGAALVDGMRQLDTPLVLASSSLGDGPVERWLPDLHRNGARTLVLCEDCAPERFTAILAAGASGCLLVDTSPGRVLECMWTVAEGAAVLDPAIAGDLLDQWRDLRAATSENQPRLALTPREIDVLAGMVDGLPTKSIARRLGVALKTVENHKLRIFGKLGARTHAHAVTLALQQGLLGTADGTPAMPAAGPPDVP